MVLMRQFQELIREQVYKNNSDYELNCDMLESLSLNIPTYEELTLQARNRVKDLIFSGELQLMTVEI